MFLNYLLKFFTFQHGNLRHPSSIPEDIFDAWYWIISRDFVLHIQNFAVSSSINTWGDIWHFSLKYLLKFFAFTTLNSSLRHPLLMPKDIFGIYC